MHFYLSWSNHHSAVLQMPIAIEIAVEIANCHWNAKILIVYKCLLTVYLAQIKGSYMFIQNRQLLTVSISGRFYRGIWIKCILICSQFNKIWCDIIRSFSLRQGFCEFWPMKDWIFSLSFSIFSVEFGNEVGIEFDFVIGSPVGFTDQESRFKKSRNLWSTKFVKTSCQKERRGTYQLHKLIKDSKPVSSSDTTKKVLDF